MDPVGGKRGSEVNWTSGCRRAVENVWCLSSLFGQEGDGEQKLKNPRGIATNSSGQFIVGDINEVKMFYSRGEFIKYISIPNDDVDIWDVATDNQDNIYVLGRCKKKTGSNGSKQEFVVYEFSNTSDLHHKFPVRGEYWAKLTITNSHVLVLSRFSVAVYDTDGLFVRSFGEGTLKNPSDITAANDGRVMVVDWGDSCVHIFSEDGDYLDKFKLQGRYDSCRIAFHQLSEWSSSEHVVIAGDEEEEPVVVVEIFTKDGEFVRSSQIHEERIGDISGITVTSDGQIALLVIIDGKCKVFVL